MSPAVNTRVYVVSNRGINTRIRGISRLQSADVEVVYVTYKPADARPAGNLVAQPIPNPFGLLRVMGFPEQSDALSRRFYFPGRESLYALSALRQLRRRVRDDLANGLSVTLLTCAPPHALCLVGRSLKSEFPALRWVIDWQDLWSSDETYFLRVHPRFRARALEVERALTRESDLNIATNDLAAIALQALDGIENDRVLAIPHHFEDACCDVSDLRCNALARRRSGSTPRIAFMGGLFKPPKVLGHKFIEALRRVRAGTRVKPEFFVYSNEADALQTYIGREPEYGLVYQGLVSRKSVVDTLRKYDFLLLLLEDLPNSRLIMHLKLPEYLVAGPPIVAIVPRDSAVAEIVRRTGAGYVIDSASDWAVGIADVLERWHAGEQLQRNESEIERYAWRTVQKAWRKALLPLP
jgi:hypothetical protein